MNVAIKASICAVKSRNHLLDNSRLASIKMAKLALISLTIVLFVVTVVNAQYKPYVADPEKLAHLRSLVLAELSEDRAIDTLTSDHFLSKFLRASNDDAESAMRRISTYMKYFRNQRELFFDASERKRRSLDSWFYVQKEKTKSGARIGFLDIAGINYNRNNITQYCAALIPELERVGDDLTQSPEVVAIADAKGFSPGLLASMNPEDIIVCLDVLLNAMPYKLKVFHFVNQNIVVDMFFALARTLILSPEQSALYFMHGRRMKRLHKYVDKRILPVTVDGWKELRVYNEEEIKEIDEDVNRIWSELD